LLVSSTFGIDNQNVSNSILNIGTTNSSIINIGNSSSTINFNNNTNITGNTNISGIYKINGSQISTSNILEGTNLYYTNSRAKLVSSINITSNGLTYDNITGIFTLGLSSTSTIGALSNTDWNIFNNKVNKSGDNLTGNLLFNSTFGIDNDTGSNKILNIGTVNSNIINIGSSTSGNYIYAKNNLYVSGNIQASGEVYSGATISPSDINLKTNIKNLENNIIEKLIPVQYEWKKNIDFISEKK